MSSINRLTTITIRENNYERLRNLGRTVESFNDVLTRILSQLTLLKTIGASQMEKELVKKFRSAEKHTHDLETIEESYSEEDVKRMVHEVLN